MSRTYPARSAVAVALRLTAAFAALFAGTWLVGWVLLRSGWCDPVLRVDQHIATWVSAHRTPWVTRLMRTWTKLGTQRLLVPLVVAAGILLRRRAGTWRPLAMLAGTCAGLPLVYRPIKDLLERPRPRVAPIVATEHSWAYPSGHAAQAAAMACLLAWMVTRRLRRSWARRTVIAVAAVLAVGVMASRVELGVHWTTDVVAGALLGALWAAALIAISER
jgi:membrane-associated phospholipid phosphatase